jgi:hypothetical protein
MRSIKHAMLLAVALVVVCAYGASAAFAAPEFKAEGGGSVAGTSLTTTSANPVLYTKGAGIKIKCSSEESTGQIASSTTINKTAVTYAGCRAFHGTTECGEARTKAGTVAEQIKTKTLKGKLGEVAATEATSEVGLRLEPESGTTFVEIELKPSCNGLSSATITGHVIGEASPINVFSTTGNLNFETVAEEQKIKKFVGGATEVLEAFFFKSALEANEAVTFGKAIETT